LSPLRWQPKEQDCYANQMLKRIFVGISAILLAGVVLAQAYRWVDADGVVHFSDKPGPGAERIELPSSDTNAVQRRPVTPSTRSSTPSPEPVSNQAAFSYESVAVASPAAEETLWNIAPNLNVSVDLQPGLQPGHQIRVFFDGEPRGTFRSTSFQLDEVWRGAHNIQVEVLDQGGNMMTRSQPNRFYVQQTRAN
jgi:hypothetical protein